MSGRKAAAMAGVTLMLSGVVGAGLSGEAQAAGCTPSVRSYGPVWAINHNGARLFSRTVTIYNSCSDTTWTMDIRPLAADRGITIPTRSTRTYSISSSWGNPYLAGFKAR